jgi:probable HAF family extracellular repeat protein
MAAAVAILFPTTAPVAVPAQYHLTPLGLAPNHTSAGPRAININGQIVGLGAPQPPSIYARGWVYDNGQMIDLGEVAPVDVNDSGKALLGGGEVYDIATGTRTPMAPAPAGNTGISANGINDAGAIAVDVYFSPDARAYLYNNGTYTPVGPATVAHSANAINATGQVTGAASEGLVNTPFRYTPGVGPSLADARAAPAGHRLRH